MVNWLLSIVFPPKCVLCGALLEKNETDFCHHCRKNAPEFTKTEFRLSFVAGWTSVWYYKDTVRNSLHKYKFRGRRCYAPAYGRMLAMKLTKENMTDFDILTYVPVSALRRLRRGYDQVELLGQVVGKELGVPLCRTLRKIRNTPPQSRIKDASRRRANVLGAYKPVNPVLIRGKRVLLLDDIITTGATASECARTLLTAGAKEVFCATMAATNHNTK